MDKIEALIKKLTDFKEELNKNVNMSYSSPANVAKDEMNKKPDIVRPDAGYGKVTVKDTGGGPPADPKKPGAYGKVIMKEDEPHKNKVKSIASNIKEEAEDIASMHKDEMMMMGEGCGMGSMKMAKNGQWSMHKGAFKELEHKLEHEGKSKESAGAIAYSVGKKKYGKAGMEHKAEAARKSDDDGDMEKSVYNAGTHPMKERESRIGNFPHIDYDHGVSHEDNRKQFQAHFKEHKHHMPDARLETYLNQQKSKK